MQISAAGLGLGLWLLCVGLCVGSFLNTVIHRLPLMLHRQWRREVEAHSENAPADAAEVDQGKPLAATLEPEGAKAADRAAAQPQGNSSASAPHLESAHSADDPVARFNLMRPRSHCPACRRPIKAVENIPVLSWLWLRGKCAGCAASISLRYPLVETLGAAAALWAVAAFGFTWLALAAAVYAWALIALAGTDLETGLLPDQITLPLMWLGLLVNLGDGLTPLAWAVIGAAAGYLSLWSLYWAFKLATGKEGMGYGDFKLLAAIGAWLGWQALPAVVLLAAAAGLLYALTAILLGRRTRRQPIPFGPFLAAAGWAALIWREQTAALLGA